MIVDNIYWSSSCAAETRRCLTQNTWQILTRLVCSKNRWASCSGVNLRRSLQSCCCFISIHKHFSIPGRAAGWVCSVWVWEWLDTGYAWWENAKVPRGIKKQGALTSDKLKQDRNTVHNKDAETLSPHFTGTIFTFQIFPHLPCA